MITMPDDGGCSPKGNVSIDEADVSPSPYFVGKERNFSSVSRNGAVPCFYGDMAGKTVSQRIRIKFLMRSYVISGAADAKGAERKVIRRQQHKKIFFSIGDASSRKSPAEKWLFHDSSIKNNT